MNLTFNDDHYLQVGGTAMGTTVSPNYATLFMYRFETKALDQWEKKKPYLVEIYRYHFHGVDSWQG